MPHESSINFRNVPETDNITAGDYILTETPVGTHTLDFRNFVISESNITFAPRLSSLEQGVNENLSRTDTLTAALLGGTQDIICRSLSAGHGIGGLSGKYASIGYIAPNYISPTVPSDLADKTLGIIGGLSARDGLSAKAVSYIGKLGVNTTAPDYDLDVKGNVGVDEYIYHNDDTDTYLRFESDQLSFIGGGVEFITFGPPGQDEVVVNDGGGNVDFRVETNSGAHAIFTNANNDRVGIFNSSPGVPLHVTGATTIDGGNFVFNDDSGDYNFRVESNGNANALYVDGGNNRVGILNGTPSYTLDVTGDINCSGALHIGSFYCADDIVHEGDTNTFIDFGDDQIHFDAGGTTLLSLIESSQDEVVVNEDGGDVDFRVETDAQTYGLYVQGSSDRVGINTGSPGVALHVTGAIYATSDITAFYSSDERLKTDITKIDSPLDKLDRMSGYTFKWKDEPEIPHNDREAGVIAQEVREVLPEVVMERDDGTLGVRYEQLTPLLIEAIKELNEKVNKLSERIK